jgi:1,4-alpha-glucan branching enzyme
MSTAGNATSIHIGSFQQPTLLNYSQVAEKVLGRSVEMGW